MNLQLIRDYAGLCTLGRLTVDAALTLQTLARPWVADPPYLCGPPDTSCVPAGTYELVLHDTPKFPRHFALVNEALGVYHEAVPGVRVGRTACLLHVANDVDQLEGCIAVGRTREYVGDQWMVLNSRDAYAAFAAAVPWVPGHTLTITYAEGVKP